jgi:hypothetical protein
VAGALKLDRQLFFPSVLFDPSGLNAHLWQAFSVLWNSLLLFFGFLAVQVGFQHHQVGFATLGVIWPIGQPQARYICQMSIKTKKRILETAKEN